MPPLKRRNAGRASGRAVEFVGQASRLPLRSANFIGQFNRRSNPPPVPFVREIGIEVQVGRLALAVCMHAAIFFSGSNASAQVIACTHLTAIHNLHAVCILCTKCIKPRLQSLRQRGSEQRVFQIANERSAGTMPPALITPVHTISPVRLTAFCAVFGPVK